MNLYLIRWKTRLAGLDKNDPAYGTYIAAVVAAPDTVTARGISPRTGEQTDWHDNAKDAVLGVASWASRPVDVEALLIGQAKPGTDTGLILASYAGG